MEQLEEFFDRFNCNNFSEVISLMEDLKYRSGRNMEHIFRCNWCFRQIFCRWEEQDGTVHCDEVDELNDDVIIPRDNILFDDEELCYDCCKKMGKELILSYNNVQDSTYKNRKIQIEDYAGGLYKNYLKAFEKYLKDDNDELS